MTFACSSPRPSAIPESMIRLVALLLGAFLAACAHEGVGQNPDPIPRIEFERTRRLHELRDSLDAKNRAYIARTGNKLHRNTNKRKMGGLEDEYANWDQRAQRQIERELARRYLAGDTAAYYTGIEALVPTAVPPTPTTSP